MKRNSDREKKEREKEVKVEGENEMRNCDVINDPGKFL